MKSPNMYKDSMNCFERICKRTFDIVFSALGMILVAPVALLIAVTIKWESEGPAFYKQQRIGLGGKPFYIYKFRSMRSNADEDRRPLLCQDNDDRLTPFGRFIRSHHLDEIPQLWNIFIGDMSFVGPRPERKYFVDIIVKHNPDYQYLYQLRPGVFSKATLYNGYTDTLEKMLERLRMDLEYLTTRSFYSDLKIIVMTVYFILSGKKF